MKIKILKKISIIILLIICLFLSISKANTEDKENININEILQAVNAEVDVPKISSKIALIYDRASGEVIYEKNGYRKAKMASTTKIMTSLIVLEKGNLSDTVTVSKKAAGTGGSRLGLKTNDKITVNDLLMGLMLESGNDAAIALAEHIGGGVEKFADLMNAKAKELGLKNTHFVVPHGLDNEEHYTTALELAKITDYALKIEKFRNIVATKEYNEQNRPYLHMYVELERDALLNTAMSTNILKDLLSTYFKYIDQDYRDLKKILGMDPLQVTIFTCGTFEAYEKKTGKKIHQMSPSHYELKELLDIQESLNRVI